MKTFLRYINQVSLIVLFSMLFNIDANGATCNWKNRNPYFSAWDSCQTVNNVKKASLNGYVVFNSNLSGCFKYTWKVNGTVVGYGRNLNYKISSNGTYSVCVVVYDSCNNCDTSICAYKTISCFPSCNWKGKNATVNGWDSCKGYGGRSSVNAYISFGNNNSGCFKYQWSVNNSIIKGANNYIFSHTITQNGTYNLCVKVMDTCNKCDTTYCLSKSVSCLSNKCNWSNRSMYFQTWDSCKNSNGRSSINGYIGSNGNKSSCYKYKWKVNNTIVGYGNTLSYAITQNGTYVICANVLDSCDNCDTTFCFTKTISCFTNTSKCAWYKRQISYSTWDSCNGKRYKSSINGSFNTQNKCYKLQWIVNNTVVSDNVNFSYQVTKNGYYSLCLKIIDTCDKCDTMYCRGFNITCFPSCNWKGKNAYMYGWDTCKGNGQRNSVNAYISFGNNSSGCFKYQWKVNGVAVKGSTSNILNYPIFNNGTYNLCVTVHDTCKGCDTSYCLTKTISCFTGCNWKSKSPYMYGWDTCKGNNGRSSVNAYISFGNNSSGCFKYQWKVNGVAVKGATSNILNYPVHGNGSYTMCVVVHDTCHKCDTSICITKNISCFSTCNWKSRIYTTNVYDSCNGTRYRNSSNGYVVMNQNSNNSCVKYTWKINGTVVSNTYYFHAPIYHNGTYNYCLTLYDTCLKCDTSVCFTRTYNCHNLGINGIDKSEVTVYPNPSSDVLHVNSYYAFYSASITDLSGKTIWKGAIKEGDNEILLSGTASGMYYLRLEGEQGVLVEKIQIE